jgi:TonB family protein
MGMEFQPSLLVSALLSWSEQVLVLVAAGAIGAMAIAHPKARLLLWQGLLLLLLLLPAIEPRRISPVEGSSGTELVSVNTASPVSAPPGFRWQSEDWLGVILAGGALRLFWVAAGFLRLRRYRRQAKPLAEPPLRFTADAVSWYTSDSVPGPVTYGWKRPVILLPTRVLELPEDLREAIECHELIHIRRGDWLFVVAEALVRSLLWFHPAIWFVLSRIQLAREQAVDQEAVSLLQNRERYLDALVAVAGYELQPELMPAPLFLKKRHLAARVKAVMKEVKMSRSKLLAGVTAVCSAMAIAGFAAVWLFPFVSPAVSEAQTAPDSPGVTVDAGAALMHRMPVHTPQGSKLGGTVVVQARLNAKGEVSDAQVLSGPEELRKEVLGSVLQWHYQPGPALAQISVHFEAASSDVSPAPPVAVPPTLSTSPVFGTLKSISISGLSAEAEQELRSRLPVHEGDTVTQSDMSNLNGVVRSFDSHLVLITGRSGPAGDLTARISLMPPPPVAPPPPPLAQAGPLPSAGIHVAQDVQAAKLTNRVVPVYPPIAKQARVQGSVTMQANIAKDGTVRELQIVEAGSPLLVQAAMDAVKQWTYQPTLLNGSPVDVTTTVTVNFTLQ